jgi:hypothetical protein
VKGKREKVSPAVRQMETKAKAIVSAPQIESTTLLPDEARFTEVIALIEAARNRAYQAINTELVSLYWQLGEHISQKIDKAEWGDGVVDDLAAELARRYPGVRGHTRPNLFPMRQFYEAYRRNEKVSPLVRQLPWTHHLIIPATSERRNGAHEHRAFAR